MAQILVPFCRQDCQVAGSEVSLMCMYWNHPPDKFPESFTSRYALDKLQCAHRHLMQAGIWYDKGLKEADKLICVAASAIRQEARTVWTVPWERLKPETVSGSP